MCSDVASPLWRTGSRRLQVVSLVALALTIEGLMRSNLNMAMVCMLDASALVPPRPARNATETPEECPLLTFGEKPTRRYSGSLVWQSRERALIFAAFYLGGLLATVTTEMLNRRWGAKKTVLYGAIVNVIGTFVTPLVSSHLGWGALMAVRFAMGCGQGVLWPCMSVLIGAWFPLVEKSTALAIATTGNQVSVIVALFATAELCQVPFWGGWPFAFYVYGVLGVVLCILWAVYVENSPQSSERIKETEKTYILENKPKGGGKARKPDWESVLSSPVVWSIAGSSFCHNFITAGTITYLPQYYSQVLNMSLTSNGVLSALPFVCQFISKVAFAGVADAVKKRKWTTVTTVTKACNSAASLGISVSFLLLSFCDCSSRTLAVLLVSTAMAFVSGFIPGYNTSVVCVAPTQTAAIASFSRMWAQIGSSLAPYLFGFFTQSGTAAEWRFVFLFCAGACALTGTFFQCCGSASVQTWDAEEKLYAETIKEELIDKEKKNESESKVLA